MARARGGATALDDADRTEESLTALHRHAPLLAVLCCVGLGIGAYAGLMQLAGLRGRSASFDAPEFAEPQPTVGASNRPVSPQAMTFLAAVREKGSGPGGPTVEYRGVYLGPIGLAVIDASPIDDESLPPAEAGQSYYAIEMAAVTTGSEAVPLDTIGVAVMLPTQPREIVHHQFREVDENATEIHADGGTVTFRAVFQLPSGTEEAWVRVVAWEPDGNHDTAILPGDPLRADEPLPTAPHAAPSA